MNKIYRNTAEDREVYRLVSSDYSELADTSVKALF